ncbi:DNA replication/repair protein RecF [Psychrobacter lutiphocae]|uniref:DNA replication/repair protein RecF n=1 Tax=Psychrobacter lutiphocae TaxID=540500 RepID=UPI00035C755B|nr:DNA replication and repair protein RecF [Psychrobacter lutiphocae]
MLTHLSIYQLRNLQTVNISLGQCNVFVGANGSGKTSLLESLYLLSRGKSFRHHQPKRYITHHAKTATVHAKFADGGSMAIQKAQDASSVMRLGQQNVYVQSALAKQLPSLLIDPSSMDILEMGSGSRRQLLDWIAFHVKPGFHPQWLAYQRLLKQRNVLLKQSPRLSTYQMQELMAWDKGLATHAALITHYRQQAFVEWKPVFEELIEKLLPEYAPFIQLKFSAGYNTKFALDELLQQRLAQDCHMGYTRIGCHRADVQVLWVDDDETRQLQFEQQQALQSELSQPTLGEDTLREQAANVLSRGEKKLLITALRLSQLPLLVSLSSSGVSLEEAVSEALPVVLLDDITAELDERGLEILLQTLSKLSCQVFITSLDTQIMDKIINYWPQAKLFHVKQGSVTEAV